MSATQALNVERLRKVWAMAERGGPGEQVAARSRAEAMLRPHGKTLADIPALLSGPESCRNRSAFDAPTFDAAAQYADYDRRFRGFMHAERAKMSPERRAESEAFERWMKSGAMLAKMRWDGLSVAQRTMLRKMGDTTTTARQRKTGCVLDLFDADGRLVELKIGMESTVGRLVILRLVKQEYLLIFRLTASGLEVLKHRNSQAPKGPYN